MSDVNACAHERYEPVTLVSGEHVATICTACFAQLPAAWGCTDCEWIEIRRLLDPLPQLWLGVPCLAHRDAPVFHAVP